MARGYAISAARHRFAGRATVARSVRLASAFRVEQTDPAFFYGQIAEDTVAQLRAFDVLAGARVVDIGGGPGYFRAAFAEADAEYLQIDYDRTELEAADLLHEGIVIGSGLDLPLRTGCVDICFSSNVLEHVPAPERMAEEMVRVTRPGGLVYLSYTLWLSPWGGHETAPWHFLGGRYAAARYTRRKGHPPKNVFGESLYALSAGRMLRWARQAEARGSVEMLASFPRYLPAWMYWVTRVPVVREFVLWNLVLVLRRR